MNTGKLFGLVAVFIGIVILTIFLVWLEKLQKPTPGKSCKSGSDSDFMWNDSCLYIDEVKYDSSLQSPKNLSPVLTNFTTASGSPSFYKPAWYRFRYVNTKTGAYSDFSGWSKSPVISGSCCLPCPGGKCSFNVGGSTCSANQPQIGIASDEVQYSPTKLQPDGSFIYMNLHRYVDNDITNTTPPDDSVQDEIVGYLLPTAFVGGKTYYTWTDALKNPCEGKSCPTPTWCKTRSDCSDKSCPQ